MSTFIYLRGCGKVSRMEKYTLITGASSGIGRAIAIACAKEGKNLILTADNNKSGLFETLSLVKHTYVENFGTGPARYMHCRTFICDVADTDMVDYLFEELEKENCRIEGLVNNAAVSHFELIQDMSMASWRRVMGINLDGAFYMCKKVIPQMLKEKKGAIVNISSYWGIAGSAMESAYCASKGGLNAFTLSLAKELKESNIRVNAIACEFVNTRMNDFLSEQEIADVLKQMPSGRIIEPCEIADLVTKLLAPDCAATGRIIGMEDL